MCLSAPSTSNPLLNPKILTTILIFATATSDSDTTRKSLGSIGTGSSGGTTGSSSSGGGGSSRSGCSSSSGSAGSGPKWTCAYCKGQNLGDAAKCGTCKQEKYAVESKKSTSGGSSSTSGRSGGTSGSGDSSSGGGGKGGPSASVRKPVAPAPAPTPATAPAAASRGHRWVCAYCKSKNAPEATACAGCRQEKFEDAKKAAKAALKSKSVPAPALSPAPSPAPAPAAPPVAPPAVSKFYTAAPTMNRSYLKRIQKNEHILHPRFFFDVCLVVASLISCLKMHNSAVCTRATPAAHPPVTSPASTPVVLITPLTIKAVISLSVLSIMRITRLD